jgi:hypothetical protein
MPPTNLKPLGDAEYDSIAAALMETDRGRWFLAEYARRNRNADTAMLMSALQRLEKVMGGHAAAPAEGTRAALAEMARALERTKAPLAVLRPDAEKGRRLTGAKEFEAVGRDYEEAAADIVAAAERVQDVVWSLREIGVDDKHCVELESRAADIYAACARQDLVAQRTRRMIQALRFLDARIGSLLTLWGGGPSPAAEPQADPSEPEATQAEATRSETLQIADAASQIDNEEVDAPGSERERDCPSAPDRFTQAAALLAVNGPHAVRGRSANPGPSSRDPLASLRALTPEETVALFS